MSEISRELVATNINKMLATARAERARAGEIDQERARCQAEWRNRDEAMGRESESLIESAGWWEEHAQITAEQHGLPPYPYNNGDPSGETRTDLPTPVVESGGGPS